MWAAVSRQRRSLNVFYTLAKFGYLNGKPKHLSGWHICPKIMHGIYNLYKLYIYISDLYRLYIEQRPQLPLLMLLLCETRSGGLQKLFENFKKMFQTGNWNRNRNWVESIRLGSSTYVRVTHTQCGRKVVYRGGESTGVDKNCICKRKQSKLTDRETETETETKTESETEARASLAYRVPTICVCLHRNAIYLGKGAGIVGGDGNAGGVGVSSIIGCIIGCNASAIFAARGWRRRRQLWHFKWRIANWEQLLLMPLLLLLLLRCRK